VLVQPASADPNDFQSISRGPSLTAYAKNAVYGRLGELQERGRMVLRKVGVDWADGPV
jgi:hypothetical protein